MTDSPRTPRVSVIIPTRNRPAPLRRCLDALYRQSIPANQFEIIVIDDGSVPPIAGRFADGAATGHCLRIVRQENAGPAAARNRGAELARAPLVAFVDDDCAPDTHWLQQLLHAAADHPDAGIGGQLLNAIPQLPGAAASQLLIDYLYLYYEQKDGPGRFFVTANAAFPRDAFRSVGGFDASFPLAGGEDRDFCDRWLESGRQLVSAPGAIVHHYHALTFPAFCRQHFNYGRGAFHLHRARGKRSGHGIELEPLRFYVRLLQYPFQSNSTNNRWTASALMGMSQVMYLSGYLKERLAARDR